MLTGQLIFRNTDAPAPRLGYRIMMVCGIVAIPSDLSIKSEHQYVITGGNGTRDGIGIYIHANTEIDLTKHVCGFTLDRMITSPLWRV